MQGVGRQSDGRVSIPGSHLSPDISNPGYRVRNRTLRKLLLIFGLELARRALKKVLRV